MIKTRNPNDIIDYCREVQMPFTLYQTMFTKRIVCELGEYKWNSNDSELSFKELGFIQKVKKHYSELNLYPQVNKSNIKYIKQGKVKNSRLTKDLFEIDLKSAYWELSKKHGYLNKDLYNEGKSVKKKVRLIALGNLAKRISVFKFDGKEFGDTEYISSDNTENYFFKVSQETDLIMRNLIMIAQKSFLFYWVDAIFINDRIIKNHICEFLESNDIDFKVIKIHSLTKKDSYIKVLNENPNLLKGEEAIRKNKRIFLFTKNKEEVLTKIDRKKYE